VHSEFKLFHASVTLKIRGREKVRDQRKRSSEEGRGEYWPRLNKLDGRCGKGKRDLCEAADRDPRRCGQVELQLSPKAKPPWGMETQELRGQLGTLGRSVITSRGVGAARKEIKLQAQGSKPSMAESAWWREKAARTEGRNLQSSGQKKAEELLKKETEDHIEVAGQKLLETGRNFHLRGDVCTTRNPEV